MRVLLVEDDTATAQGIEMMLRSEGYVCDTTDMGEDGLEIGKLYDYDIIILDLMRPDMDGDRKSVVEGKGVAVREDIGGRGIMNKKKSIHKQTTAYPETKKH